MSGDCFASTYTKYDVSSSSGADATGGDAPDSREPDGRGGTGSREDARAKSSVGPGEGSGATVAAQGSVVCRSQAAAAPTAAPATSAVAVSAASAVTMPAARVARPGSVAHARAG
ncbi:unnamed protein product, partial [Laminaria digitata]